MPVSIFNDVIGPVMRGPSSSHCAAALRIGRLARDLMDGNLETVLIEFDRHGSLATTHASQGSDMGLFGGLLGWAADDERLPDSAQALRAAGVVVRTEITDFRNPHPNTYCLTLSNGTAHHRVRAVSTGGGIIEVIEIDEFSISIAGDYWETLLWLDREGVDVVDQLSDRIEADEILLHESADGQLVEVRTQRSIAAALLGRFRQNAVVRAVKQLAPILPILSRKNLTVPYSTCAEMMRNDADVDRPLWQLAIDYESRRGDLAAEKVLAMMMDIVGIARRSIRQGLDGTQYEDRILGCQSGGYRARMEAGQLLAAGVLNRIVLYVTALMEVKSSMGVIIAAPTAGACAALPGACVAVADELNLPDEAVARALLAAGMIGVLIATRSTFAAEVAGCQAETGAASCMAAAALVTLADGNTAAAVAAASMALQNCLGMTCDPVANRVEVPCLGKNVLAASNALACANMALGGYDPVIPLDEVIAAADRVGRSLPRTLRCTALGGLSTTPTSLAIQETLNDKTE